MENRRDYMAENKVKSMTTFFQNLSSNYVMQLGIQMVFTRKFIVYTCFFMTFFFSALGCLVYARNESEREVTVEYLLELI